MDDNNGPYWLGIVAILAIAGLIAIGVRSCTEYNIALIEKGYTSSATQQQSYGSPK